MNVNDLRAALRERADTVADHDAASRVGQVHERVRVGRRRRVAGAAALTAGVLALVGAVSVLPDRAQTPAAPPNPVPLAPVRHKNFVSHSGEFDLVAVKIGEPGHNRLDLTVPAHRERLRVSMACYGVSGADGFWVSGYVGDGRPDRPDSNWCGYDPDTPVVPGVSGAAPGPWIYPDGLVLPPSDEPRTIHLELTREVDENGDPLERDDEIGVYVPASDPGAVLGVGLYTVADPVATVAGAEIPPLVGPDGQDYVYEDHRESGPGERTLTWTLPPSSEARYYDVVASDAMEPGGTGPGVSGSVDGTCQSSVASARFRSGGCLLSPGRPHTITVTIDGDPPTNALLGIVLYRQAG